MKNPIIKLIIISILCLNLLACQSKGSTDELLAADISTNVPESEKNQLDNKETSEESDTNDSEEPKPEVDVEPVYTSDTYTETETIVFKTINKHDNTLEQGQSVVKVEGQNGQKVLHYERKYKDGVEISNTLIKEEVTLVAVDKVVHLGTKVKTFNSRELGQQMMAAINASRQGEVVDPVTWSEELFAGAHVRVQELPTKFDHVRPDGTQWHTVSDLARGENIQYMGSVDPLGAHNNFQASPGHRTNNMNPEYKTIGISSTAAPDGKVYWAVLFGHYIINLS